MTWIVLHDPQGEECLVLLEEIALVQRLPWSGVPSTRIHLGRMGMYIWVQESVADVGERIREAMSGDH